MKKIIGILVFSLIIVLSCGNNALAYSDENAESIAEETGANDLKSENLSADELSGDKNINVFEKVYLITVNALLDNKGSVLRSFGAIFAAVLLACVMHSMKFSRSSALDTASGYVSVLALSGVTYSVFYNLFVYIIAAMESLTLAMSALMPVMGSLYAYGGTAATGAAGNAGLAFFLTVLSFICTKVLLPLVRVAFAFCLIGAMPSSVNLSSVTNLIKSVATTLMAFLFSLLGFALYLQTAIASASDNYVMRSVRFASGVFVPVIGGMLGDASRTVVASVSAVKGAVGAAGVVMVLSAVLPPIIIAFLHKILLLMCAATAKSLSCERESAFLYDLLGVINVLLALVIGSGAVCLIALGVFVKSGVTV